MKHAAPADQTPAPASSPETTARRRFSAPKIIGIVAGSIVGLPVSYTHLTLPTILLV